MPDLKRLTPSHLSLFRQLEAMGYPVEQAFANAMLWQARAETGIARWNKENPGQPMTMEDWLARYPLTVTSVVPQGQAVRTLHQFAGPGAATAQTSSLAVAMRRIREGGDAEEVRRETGWFKGLDGHWRFEIDDSEARFRGFDHEKNEEEVTSSRPELYETWMDEALEAPRGVRLNLALHHPKLFAAYPHLGALSVVVNPRRRDGACMHENLATGELQIEIGDPYGYRPGEAIKSLMHEIQHVIQVFEGFARGGNPEDVGLPTGQEICVAINGEYRQRAREIEESAEYRALVDSALADLDAAAWVHPRSGERSESWARRAAEEAVYESSGLAALERERVARIDVALSHVGAFGQGVSSRFAGYRHLAGEAEARNAADRVSLSEDERRQTSPWATLDIDPRDAIVRLESIADAAQMDDPLRSPATDRILIGKLAEFQRLPVERQFDEYEKREALFDQLVSHYRSDPEFRGVFFPLAHGWVGVTGSAKQAGRWQVTSFDAQMVPMSDTGAKPLADALREAVSEARFDLIDEGRAPADARGVSLPRSRVRGADGQLLKVYHGTAEVKVIPGDSVPGDPSAIAELKALAERFGIEDYTSVAAVLDRLGVAGQRGRLGETEGDAVRARELHERARYRVEPSRNAIGFDAFRMPPGDMELGAHFGSRDQALLFGEPFEFYLDLRNPVRLPDLGNWHVSRVIGALRGAGVEVSSEEESRVAAARDQNGALRALMLSKGYDGVVYRNEAEGFGDSYIALTPESIYPADQVVVDEPIKTQSPAFREWFGQSVATVDGQPGGQPAVLYHGSDADIELFDGREIVAWVTDDPGFASAYAMEARSGLDEDESAPNVLPVYASIQRPLVLDMDMNEPVRVLRDALEQLGLLSNLRLIYDHVDDVWEVVNTAEFMQAIGELGYDGVRVRERGVWTWAVASQSQLKSIFNRGEFSPASPFILEQSPLAEEVAPAFSRWFGSSPVRQSDGRPQVMYHGSKTPEGLTVFVPGGRDPAAQSGDMLGVASYFTSDPEEASRYAGEQGAVLPVYLSGSLLNLELPVLPPADSERLSAFAARVLLPADRARFSSLRKARFFTEDELEQAKAFFQAERERWQSLDGVMERAKPEVDKQGDLFVVRFTDFESPVVIRTSDDAEALFRSVGWGNLPALGFDGVMLTNSEGRRWVAMHRPEGTVKSAIGNNGLFNRYSARILDQSAYHGTVAEFDRFDLEAGRGVGRSYGYGVYLTADRGVADRYRQMLARHRGWIGEVASVIAARFAVDYPDALVVEGYQPEVLAASTGALVRLVENYADPAFLVWADELSPVGRVYQAQIPSFDELLSWDAPISAQPPAIREVLYSRSLHTVPLQPGFDMRGEFERSGEPTGADIYVYLAEAYGDDRKASEVLSALGVKGLTYRNMGFGSRDFVVFDPADAQIKTPTVESSAFAQWFGESVLTEDGEPGGRPMVFYHGARPGVDFDVFRAPSDSDGIYFTPDPGYAEGFTSALFDPHPESADGPALSGQIMPVYLRAERPFVVIAEPGSDAWESFVYRGLDCAELALQGYDAAVLKEAGSGFIDQVIVFSALQIKSAIGNSGAFDRDNPSILSQGALEQPLAAAPGRTLVSSREENLLRWFGVSKTVGPDGRPQVFYHITPHDFEVFHPGGKTALEGHPEGLSGKAMWFSPNREYQPAAHNVMTRDGFQPGTRVMPVHLKIDRPLLLDDELMLGWARDVFAEGSSLFPQVVLSAWVDALKAAGYDGIICRGVGGANERNGDEYVVFDAHQVKSAIGNAGSYDPTSPSILNQSAASAEPGAADWFGRSVLTDSGQVGGVPLVLYHGTSSAFTAFRPSEHGEFGPGVYLSFSEASARKWGQIAGGRGGEVQVLRVHVRMVNPFRISKLELQELALEEDADGEPIGMLAVHARLREQGYDGIIGTGLTDSDVQVVAFDGDQVQLVQAAAQAVAEVAAQEMAVVMTPEFESWFQGSVVADNGVPKKVYHGSRPHPDSAPIEVFDRLFMVAQGRRRVGQDNVGIWFTETLGNDGVDKYSGGDRVYNGAVYPVYLSIKNPWRVSFDGMRRVANRLLGRERDAKLDEEAVDALRAWMVSNGVDGIQLLHDPREGDEFASQQVWIALEPEQIRTAITADVRYELVDSAKRRPAQVLQGAVDRALASPAFRDWFAASRATVDGKPGSAPLVLFHGTQSDVEAFDPARQGETVSSQDVGFFFTNFPKEAGAYATADWWREDPRPNVMPVFLSLQNPKELSCDPFEGPGQWYDAQGQDIARQAVAEGYDGLIVRSSQPTMVMPNGEQVTLYVAFDPAQIKSALGNVGSYDRTDSRILFQSTGPDVLVNPFQMEAWTRKTGLTPAAVESIAKIGNGQRGKPERLMVEAQMIMGGGVLQYVIEHVGDLTDRMSPRHGLEWSYAETVEKAETCLRKLRSAYGFAREHAENLASNARYRGVPLEQHAAAVSVALEQYADAHAELEAPTRIHAFARDAAVLLGRQDFAGAAEKLEALLAAIPTFDAYLEALSAADVPGVGLSFGAEKVAFDFSRPADGNVIRDHKMGGALLSLSVHADGEVSLSSLRVPVAKRGRGAARRAMQSLLQQADEQGVAIKLGASALDRRTRTDKLVAFYQSLGFELTGGKINALGEPEMLRRPAGLSLRDENLRRWFGDSKVVDGEGKPLVVYHGTRTKGESIGSFDISKAGSKTDSGWMGKGFYFGDQRTADAYAGHYEFNPDHFPEGGQVYPVYLSLQNPAILLDGERNDGPRTMVRELLDLPDEATADEVRDGLLAAGYDGVIYERFSPYGSGYKEYVAFRPEQIKSAIGNNGDFDPSSPNILFQSPAPGVAPANRDGDFRRWFGDSKVVNDVGRPLRVYHGTCADFDEFALPGKKTGRMSGGRAIFFAESPDTANSFARYEGGRIIPAFLCVERPFDFRNEAHMARFERYLRKNFDVIASGALYGPDAALSLVRNGDFGLLEKPQVISWMKRNGFDGIRLIERGDEKTYAVFSPEQIKSAIGISGDFSPADPRILAQSAVHAAAPAAAQIEVDELSAQEQEDLVTALLEGRSESFSRATAGDSYSEEYVRQELFGLQDPLMVRRITLPLEAISAVGRSCSESAAAAYAGLSSKAPAILVQRDVDGWSVVEGGHRYQAAVLRGDAFVDVIDVTEILQMDWKAYLVGESMPGMPLKSLAGAMSAVETGAVAAQSAGAARRAENFLKWFAGSKVVGEDGQPVVVFHGTSRSFAKFEASRGNGYYFTDDRDAASAFAENAESDEYGEEAGPNLIPAYLSLKNPLVLDAQWQVERMGDDGEWDWEVLDHALYEAEDAGYDGAILRGFMDYAGNVDGRRTERRYNQYIAFRSEQIKSAIGNNGDFDPATPNILFQSPVLGVAPANRDEGFRRWFGDSKIVDAEGSPLVMYHGTDQDFSEFNAGERGTINFTSSPRMASRYATDRVPDYEAAEDYERGEHQNVMPVYLRVENPYDPENESHQEKAGGLRNLRGDWETLERYVELFRKAGFDGILVDGLNDVAVFEPEQIKSAIGNNGDFDPASPNILSQSVVPSDFGDRWPMPGLSAKARDEDAAFKAWFGASRATRTLQPGGDPLVVYHGTGADFDEFSDEFIGSSNDEGFAGRGFYFMDDPEWASGYAELAGENGGQPNVIPVHLHMENPLIIRSYDELPLYAPSPRSAEAAAAMSDALRERGHDGVIVLGRQGKPSEFMVLAPEQVKSAIANRGTWDRLRRSILDQSAWHGTPYQFESFDLAKVGTSEGAAAYGWGVYFASEREVALQYSGALGLSGSAVPYLFTIRGVPTQRGTPEQKAADLVHGLGITKARKLARQWIKEASVEAPDSGVRGPDYYAGVLATIEGLRSARDVRRAPGSLVRAQIPDIDQLLDWDAPMSGQPAAVLRAIESLSSQLELPQATTGGDWYMALGRAVGSSKQASFYLRAEGVLGISYLDGVSGAQGQGSRNFVIFDERLMKVLGREQVAVLDQFAGVGAVGADLLALKLAKRLARDNSPAQVWAETGWTRGVDGQWKFELDDSQAALRPEMLDLLRQDTHPLDVSQVVAHVGEDGRWTVRLLAADGESRTFQRLPAEVAAVILPHEVAQKIRSGAGEPAELAIGDAFVPAQVLDQAFRFAGLDSLPLPVVLDYPALFDAYPLLRSSWLSMIEGVRSMTSVSGDVLIGRDLHVSKLLPIALHEVQHVIQALEGFALGGAPEMAFANPATNPLATRAGLRAAQGILKRKLEEMARPATLEEYARDAWGVAAGEPVPDDVHAAYVEYVDGVARAAKAGMFSRPAQQSAAREWYRRLAGEMEARLVERRWRLSAEERRARPPEADMDVDQKDAIVLRYSASAACVEEHVSEAGRLSGLIDQYLRTDTALGAWFKQSVVDSASWSKGECEKVAVDLCAWLRQAGVGADVIFSQGLASGLDTGAAADWEDFLARGGRAEHFWHAVVLADGVVIDLSGAQFGSRYAGVRLLTPEDFHAEWSSVRVAREGASVDLRRKAGGFTGGAPLRLPEQEGVAPLLGRGLAAVHGLMAQGLAPVLALRECVAAMDASGREDIAGVMRLLSPEDVDLTGWQIRRRADSLALAWDEPIAGRSAALDALAEGLAQWKAGRYQFSVARGALTAGELLRGLRAQAQALDEADPDDALRQAMSALREAGVSSLLVEQDSRLAAVDLDGTCEAIEQALCAAQPPRAQVAIGQNLSFDIRLLLGADASSLPHEMGHAFLEILRDQARLTSAVDSQLRADWGAVSRWLRLGALQDDQPIPVEAHERFARGFELYLRKGVAPSEEMESVFQVLAKLLLEIYEAIKSLFVSLPPEIEEVYGRMLADDEQLLRARMERAQATSCVQEPEAGENRNGITIP